MCTKVPAQRPGDEPRRGPARDKRPPNPFPFVADAWAILFSPGQGGQFIAQRDVRGWFRWVFLDESPERHPFNCRYVRTLRAVRGVIGFGRVGSVS